MYLAAAVHHDWGGRLQSLKRPSAVSIAADHCLPVLLQPNCKYRRKGVDVVIACWYRNADSKWRLHGTKVWVNAPYSESVRVDIIRSLEEKVQAFYLANHHVCSDDSQDTHIPDDDAVTSEDDSQTTTH